MGKKRKYNRGAATNQYWVFGIASKKANKCHLEVIPDRKKTTLDNIISKHINKECTISHVDWRSYRALSNQGYNDHVVNHSKEFVTPEGYNTNTIEGLWGLVKLRIRNQKGVQGHLLKKLLNEFMFRYNLGKQMFIPEDKQTYKI